MTIYTRKYYPYKSYLSKFMVTIASIYAIGNYSANSIGISVDRGVILQLDQRSLLHHQYLVISAPSYLNI